MYYAVVSDQTLGRRIARSAPTSVSTNADSGGSATDIGTPRVRGLVTNRVTTGKHTVGQLRTPANQIRRSWPILALV